MQCFLSVHYFKVLYCQLFYVVTDFFFLITKRTCLKYSTKRLDWYLLISMVVFNFPSHILMHVSSVCDLTPSVCNAYYVHTWRALF